MVGARQVGLIGIVGNIVGLLALAAAVLPLWVLPAVFPPKPLEQVLVETAQRVKDRLVARAKGAEYSVTQTQDPAEIWYRVASIVAVSLGLAAVALAVISFLRQEARRFAGTAAALGIGAIAFQFIVLALCAIAALMLVSIVLGHFDLLGT
jgi:hypothetical protein